MREKLVSNASSYAKHYFYKQILNRPFGLLKQKYFIGNMSAVKKITFYTGRNLLII